MHGAAIDTVSAGLAQFDEAQVQTYTRWARHGASSAARCRSSGRTAVHGSGVLPLEEHVTGGPLVGAPLEAPLEEHVTGGPLVGASLEVHVVGAPLDEDVDPAQLPLDEHVVVAPLEEHVVVASLEEHVVVAPLEEHVAAAPPSPPPL